MTSEQHRVQFLIEIQQNKHIDFQDILKISNAFQIASGQDYAIGKTKALLDLLSQTSSLTITNYNNSGHEKLIYSAKELAHIFKNLDQFIDLETDKDFKDYFLI